MTSAGNDYPTLAPGIECAELFPLDGSAAPRMFLAINHNDTRQTASLKLPGMVSEFIDPRSGRRITPEKIVFEPFETIFLQEKG